MRADRVDGLFDAAMVVEKIDAVKCGFVDRRRLIKLRVATGNLSERCCGRVLIGEKRAIWHTDAMMVMSCRS